ncbi:MAG: AraC family transcriptional regulator [Cyclobacteriaceae bacterium]
MKRLKLHIKDMICSRCETVIRLEMKKLKAKVISIKPGYATVEVPASVEMDLIAKRLRHHGFELLTDPEKQFVEQVKTATLEYLQHQEECAATGGKSLTLSEFLMNTVGKSYSLVSKLFSRHEKKTLEHYYIELRIERVKELIDYGELNVSEIATKLGYSSGHYLSAQFKKFTGMSVSEYRKNAEKLGRKYFNKL